MTAILERRLDLVAPRVSAPSGRTIRNGRRRANRRAMWALIGSVLITMLSAVWMVTLRPASLGGPGEYVLVKGISMLPTFKTGDVVITQPADRYSAGDVIAYRVPKGDIGAGAIVIHRIVGGSAARGFLIQGDNNDEVDEWRPKPNDILGKAWIHVPALGRALTFLRAPVPMASLAAGFTVAFVLFPSVKRRKHSKLGRALSSRRSAPTRPGKRHGHRRRPSRASRGRHQATSPCRTTRRDFW
jgi:signal peptidase I